MQMALDLESIREKVVVGVITAIVLAALTLLWNWASQGGIVRALGGVTQADFRTALEAVSQRQGPLGPPGPKGDSGPPGETTLRNAVIAFDDTRCPSGWSVFTPATSRMIIGAGIAFDELYLNDADRQRLEPAKFRSHGGTVTHLLLHEEISDQQVANAPQAGNMGVGYRRAAAKPNNFDTPALFRDVLPPYIALSYCKKD